MRSRPRCYALPNGPSEIQSSNIITEQPEVEYYDASGDPTKLYTFGRGNSWYKYILSPIKLIAADPDEKHQRNHTNKTKRTEAYEKAN